MATKIQLKRSSTASDVPVAGDLAVGEVAVNTADGTLFTKHTDNSIKTISAGPIYQATNTNNVAGVWEATIPEITAYEDGQIIAFYPNKINGVSGGTTFQINSLGAKSVKRPGSATSNLTTHYHGSNLIFLRYNSSDDCFNVHADYNTTHDYNVRWNNAVVANNIAGTGTAWHGYQLVIEGIDGKFYPVTEGGSTGNTNTVSTVELRVGGTILLYENSANKTAGSESTNLYESLRTSNMHYWNNRDSGWATDNKSVYLVATKNSNGNFVLDNTSFTSFLTQDLPTSDDGKYYIKIGWMDNTDARFRLEINHPIYIYKNSAIREWGGYASNADNADQLDGVEASSFLRSDAADTATGALTFGNTITLNGSQTGGYPSLGLQPGSSSTAYITMGASADPDEGMIQYSPSSNTMAFTAGTNNVLNLTDTTIEATKDITLPDNEYVKFGASDDLTIGHGSTYGTNTIDSTQSLYISTDNSIQFRKGNFQGEFLAQMTVDGAVSLYYDNVKKFETTSTGINVTGKTTTDSLDVKVASTNDNLTVNFNSGRYDKTTTINMGNNSDPDDGYISYANLYNRFTFGMAPGGSGFKATYLDQDNLTLAQGQDVKFRHGSSNFYTTLTPSNNPSSKTITLPDATGTASVYKKTEFSLTPGSTSLTIGTSGHTNVYKYVLVMDRMNTSSGPNGPILNIEDTASTPADITWLGSSSVGSSFTQINSTDVYVALGNYHQLGDQIIEIWQANSTDNVWFLRLTAPNGYSGNYVIQGNSTSTVTGTIGGFTFSTGSSNTWSTVKGTLWEYY